MVTFQPLEFAPGQICAMEWGATQSLVNFFEVVRVTKASVWFREIPDEVTEHDGYGQAGKKAPITDSSDDEKGPIFRKKIQTSSFDGQQFAHEEYKGNIEPWNGQPVIFNTYD